MPKRTSISAMLADARQLSDIVELQNAHVRDQMETFSRQLEELRELTVKAVKDGSKLAGNAMQSQMNTTQSNPYCWITKPRLGSKGLAPTASICGFFLFAR